MLTKLISAAVLTGAASLTAFLATDAPPATVAACDCAACVCDCPDCDCAATGVCVCESCCAACEGCDK